MREILRTIVRSKRSSGRVQIDNTAKASIQALETRLLLSAATVNVTPDVNGISSQLIQLSHVPQAQASAAQASTDDTYIYDSAGRISVRVTAQDINAITPLLAGLGFTDAVAYPNQHLVDGFLPLSSVSQLDALTSDGLMGVMPTYRPLVNTGTVTSQGDVVMSADRARAASGNSGAGVTVGVLSDSFNNTIAAHPSGAGDLPASVNILQDLGSGGEDEGRAMAEIVHDVAPAAGIAFATADISEAQFAANIQNLAKPVASGGAGAKVVVDDVNYFDEPFYQDGIVAQAVNTAVTTYGAAYFSAAANLDTQAWESTNVNFASTTISTISASAALYYNFNPGGAAAFTQTLTLTNTQALTFGFEWAEPYYTVSGVKTNLDIFLLNHTTGAVVASAVSNNIASQTPFELMSFQNNTGASAQYDVVIRMTASNNSNIPPSRLKYVNFGSNQFGDITWNTFGTDSSTLNPHAGAVNAMAVAAAPYYNQRQPESFTSFGPATYLFNPDGSAMASVQVRAKPDITAPDGGDTSFFGSDAEGNGFPNFFGTSAAAPHAAAVAAIMRAVNPSLTPAQVYSALKASADPNIGAANPNQVGSGLIDAYRAVVAVSTTPGSLPFNDGMEAGYLGNAWETYNSGAGEDIVTTANTPASGSYQLILDSNLKAPAGSFFTLPTLSEDILHLNLNGSTNAMLSFSEKAFNPGGIDTNQTMPSSFTGHGNFDGVAMSVDGTTWFLVTQFLVANTSYTTFNLNLNSIAAADGITLSSNTRIKFQHYDPRATGAPNAGIAIDNVVVTSPLSLTGPAFYLKLNPDLQHLDIWTNTTGTGPTSQSLILSGISSISVTGTSGADAIVVSFAGGDPLPAGGVSYDGLGSTDSLTVVGSASNDNIVANATAITVGGVPINFANTEAFVVDPGAGSDALTVNANTVQLPSQPPTAGLLTRTFSNLVVNAPGVLVVNPTASQADRTLLSVATLSFTGTGKVDLTNNEMINNDTEANVRTKLFAGQITSSAAGGGLGYIPLSPTQTEVRFGLLGDTNLDGIVNVSDLGNLATNFGLTTGARWIQGDFDQTGTVNVADLGDLSTNFGASIAAYLPSAPLSQPQAITDTATTAKPAAAVATSAQSPNVSPSPFADATTLDIESQLESLLADSI